MPTDPYSGLDYLTETQAGKVALINAWFTYLAANTLLHPAARVYHSANQSIANNSSVVLAFNSERFDNDVIHDNATNNSRLTCKTAGKYLITFHGGFDFHATGTRSFYLRLNGATIIGIGQLAPIPATDGTFFTVSTLYDLIVNDYVEIQAYQTSGGALNVVAAPMYSPEFMMIKVG